MSRASFSGGHSDELGFSVLFPLCGRLYRRSVVPPEKAGPLVSAPQFLGLTFAAVVVILVFIGLELRRDQK